MTGGGRGPGVLPPDLDAFLDMLAAERGAARNTLDAYRRDLEDAGRWLALQGPGLTLAASDDLRGYLRHLDESGSAPRTAGPRGTGSAGRSASGPSRCG